MTKTATITVTLEEQGELTVQVNDETGAGVSTATVELVDSTGAVVQSGDTDDTGQIILGGLPIQDYDVQVTKTGYFDVSTQVASGDFT